MITTEVLGSTMTHREQGAGTPVVLLHGNPTSSHVWRGVLDRLSGLDARLLAPDLIGMGQSGKPAIDYAFDDHARYLDAWCDAVGVDDAVLVGHDWGGALALDRARRHPDRVHGVALMETILKPMAWSEFPAAAHERFLALRTPGRGEELVLEQNVFVEDALPRTVATGLSEADHDVYRAPYPTPDSRAPLLAWPRAMPLGGEPGDVVARVEAYDRWLADSPSVPKLLLTFSEHPTLMVGPEIVAWAERTVPGLEVEALGVAGHVAPEDRPVEIADALDRWLRRHRLLAQRPIARSAS